MTANSTLMGRMAQRETASLAHARKTFADAMKDLQAAETLDQRLQVLLVQGQEVNLTTASVADLRQRRLVLEQLATEADRNRTRIKALKAAARDAADALCRLDLRRKKFEEAAASARIFEAEERQARAEAMIPSRLSR